MSALNSPRPVWETMPTMYDLPSENPEEPGLPDEFHGFQPQLLRETCQSPVYPPDQRFIGTDLNLYYDGRHPNWYKRPDWFLALGVIPAQEQQQMRLSYVVWQEGIAPFLAIELLSPGTEADDLGQRLRSADQPPTKWQVYEQILRIPYYVIFDRYDNQLRAFQLTGNHYGELSLAEQKFWLQELQLGLGLWDGYYQGVWGRWLRWYDQSNQWILTPPEETEKERQRGDRLGDKLRELGIDPEGI